MQKREFIVESGARQIYGMLYEPENEPIRGGLVMSHGYNGSHRDYDCEATILAEKGYYVYLYDFCGGSAAGLSRGLATTEMTLFTEKEDLIAAASAISKIEPLAGKKLYLHGGSQGGCVTALAAAELREKVAAVMLYYPALMIPDNWRENYKTAEEIPEVTDFWGMKLGREFFMSIRDFSTYDHIGKYEGPVLIIHGDKDEIVPMAVVTKAAGIYRDAKLVVLPGEGHGFTPEGKVKAAGLMAEFLKAH